MIDDFKPGAPEHGFCAWQIRYPPVSRIVRIAPFDEIEARKTRISEYVCFRKRVVLLNLHELRTSPHQRLKDHHVAYHVLAQQVESKQRMPEVIQDPHEKNNIKTFAEPRDVIYRQLTELDIESIDVRCETGLRQVGRIEIDPEHAGCAAALHLHGIKARVTADVQHRFPLQVARNRMTEGAPFVRRVIAQKMVWRGPHTLQIEIMKPLAQAAHLLLNLLSGH